jgi:hypothetical protein
VAEFSRRLGTELVEKALADEGCVPDWDREPAAASLLARSLGRVAGTSLACALTLGLPVVAVGAPVEAYMPATARHLNTGLVIPPHAEVANAIGAVVNGVVQHLRVLVQPHDGAYRFHLPGEVRDFADLEEGVAHARHQAGLHVQAMARQAGAAQTELQVAREDHMAPDAYGGVIYIGTELTFTAVGGPGLRPVSQG